MRYQANGTKAVARDEADQPAHHDQGGDEGGGEADRDHQKVVGVQLAQFL